VHHLDEETADLQALIRPLVSTTAPELLAHHGVGPDTAAALLIAAGDNPSRLRSEATFARLCGAAPIPATSGKTQNRHRLHRGGDRQANSALWRIALTRMSKDPDTRTYITRRTQQGLSKREVMRCLKRYIARELYADLPQQMLA
jgi:transposase